MTTCGGCPTAPVCMRPTGGSPGMQTPAGSASSVRAVVPIVGVTFTTARPHRGDVSGNDGSLQDQADDLRGRFHGHRATAGRRLSATPRSARHVGAGTCAGSLIRIPSVRNMDGREPPAELVAVRRDALHRGRQTRDRERDQAVRARLSELGYTDLCAYLRTEYAAGDSLVDLRAATGLGTQRLKATSPLGWPGGCCCLHG